MSKLFPRIKFLDKNKDLDFSRENGTICHFVFQTCNLNYKQGDEVVLWGQAKKWIVKNIARLRSDKYSAMRKAFYGKSFIFIICFYIIYLTSVYKLEKHG